jgi:hypothetical protein
MYGESYTQGTDYQISGATATTSTTGATTTNYTTEQYKYQYEYQMPTTTTTTTTTQKYTTTTPVTYTQQYTTSQPVYSMVETGIPSTTGQVGVTPQYQLFRRGSGITDNELRAIVQTSIAIFQNNIIPISNNTASRVKKTLGGDWLVIVYPKNKPVDFNMTCVQGNDYLYFTLDNLAYQVCRLR